TIPAKQTERIRVKLDLTERHPSLIGLSQRDGRWEVTPYFGPTAQRQRQTTWELKGVIRSRVTLNVTQIHFGESPVQGQPAVSRKVLASVHVPYSKIEATCDPKVAAVAIHRVANSAD